MLSAFLSPFPFIHGGQHRMAQSSPLGKQQNAFTLVSLREKQETGQKEGGHPVPKKAVITRQCQKQQPVMTHMTAMAALSCLPHNEVFDGMASAVFR